jgi:hypothetical protein
MQAKSLALWVLIAAVVIGIVVATIFGIDFLVEHVFAPLLEFVLRLFTGVGR